MLQVSTCLVTPANHYVSLSLRNQDKPLDSSVQELQSMSKRLEELNQDLFNDVLQTLSQYNLPAEKARTIATVYLTILAKNFQDIQKLTESGLLDFDRQLFGKMDQWSVVFFNILDQEDAPAV